MVIDIKYSNTNTYLIKGKNKYILFDTGWAGTFNLFCKTIKEKNVSVNDIEYLFISHFHPDHMGIASQIADLGVKIVVPSLQRDYVHCSDGIFLKEGNNSFVPIDDSKLTVIEIDESRAFLKEIGIDGEIIHTPGHSEDSISILLDDGSLLVGDLNPLYELPLHKGTTIGDTWEKLIKHNPSRIFYGHAKTYILGEEQNNNVDKKTSNEELYRLVSKIMKYVDKNYSLEKIQKKTKADKIFIEDVVRMYLTHQNVTVQGILDRIEIKNK